MTRTIFSSLALSFILTLSVAAQELPSIADKTTQMEKKEGYFTVYWDSKEGKVWLEISRFDDDFLYVNSLVGGLGSNDIGLDRNQLGGTRVVRFERIGPKVLLVAPNLRYRAVSDNPAERKAVADAFASSVLWGFKVEAESENAVLVDVTEFVVRDAHMVVNRLRNSSQGTFTLDKNRSAPHPEMIKSFPKNTEIEARLTFTTSDPGSEVRSVSADSMSPTLRIRHSLIELPPPGYLPRKADPRAGYFPLTFSDYASKIGDEMRVQYIERHRLEKVNPDSARSEVIEPIVYYLDPGTPEPVRGALLDGARWWSEAFEAAGFINAYRVEMLPEDADPMDIRYNVINWVHRSTRGWSYGSTVTDPRTGEIIKGHVSLGSLRIRQDYLLAEGMLAPYTPYRRGEMDADPMLEMALARIRQLSAHEVGHTIGLAHNFAASVNDRASVMDYPAPLATVGANKRVVLSDAYDVGIGRWDEFAIRYGYSQFPTGTDEKEALDAIINEYIQEGLHYITGADARDPGGAHPLGHLWDNGEDVFEGMQNEMAVRRVAMDQFGLANIREGRPMATLEEVLVPLYMHHRYQIDAVAKLIGGTFYTYNVRGDGQQMPDPVDARQQRQAFNVLLETVTPRELALPVPVRTQLSPRPPGYGQHRELFGGYTGLIFDPYAPAEVVAGQVLGLVMHPARTARLVNQNDFNGGLPGLSEVLTSVSRKVWEEDIEDDSYYAELQRLVQQVWTDVLLEAAVGSRTSPAARARINQHLREIHRWLEENQGPDRDHETVSHRFGVYDQIDRFLFRDYERSERYTRTVAPPGSPIGSPTADYLVRQHQRREFWNEWTAQWQFCATEM